MLSELEMMARMVEAVRVEARPPAMSARDYIDSIKDDGERGDFERAVRAAMLYMIEVATAAAAELGGNITLH